MKADPTAMDESSAIPLKSTCSGPLRVFLPVGLRERDRFQYWPPTDQYDDETDPSYVWKMLRFLVFTRYFRI